MKTLTYELAILPTTRSLEHVTLKNADKTPLRARVSGKAQVWKTRPGEFRLPAKHGLKDTFQITHANCSEWVVV